MEEILASIRRIISEDGSGDDPQAESAPGPAQDSDEILELTDELAPAQDDVLEPEPLPEPEPAVYVAPEPEPEPEPVEIEAPEPPPVRERMAALDEALISKGAARASENSLSALAAAVSRGRGGPALGMTERTLEDLVKEVMRPMIRDWLDANLPGMVERLVGREIDRLSRRAVDGD